MREKRSAHLRPLASAASLRCASGLSGLALAVLTTLPMLVSAATVEGLYAAAVDLLPGEAAAGEDTARRALAAVLVKVTGLADVTGSTLVEPVLSQAQRLVQQQGFSSRRTLRYVFDEAATREAILAAGLPYWDDDRPAVMVLLQLPADALAGDSAPGDGAPPGVEGTGPSAAAGAPIRGTGQTWPARYLTGEDQGEVPDALQQAAARRGVPLLVPAPEWLRLAAFDPMPIENEAAPLAPDPLPTPTDQSASDRAARGAEESHPGLVLARRHGADVVLMGQGDRTATGVWQVRWQVLDDAQARPWIGGLEAGPEYLADLLASRYAAYVGVGIQQVGLELIGVDSVPAYAETLAYLRRLDLVQRVDLRQARPGRLLLSLSSRYEAAKLERLLQLSDFLVPASDGRAALPSTLRFEYRAVPVPTPDVPGPEEGASLESADSRRGQ